MFLLDFFDLISIVVPVYNVEPYLNRCVESLVGQTYSNLQIILVDDGSKDNCPYICDKWATLDKRIEVIHKLNSGLGLSRNEGLKQVKGKYVCFVDSDDYIHETTVEKLYNRIEENDADICYYGCVDIVQGKSHIKQPPNELNYIGSSGRAKFAAKLIGNAPHDREPLFSGVSACYAFYKADFLRQNKIQFHSEREQYISEDLIFNLTACLYADRITILPESLYYYVLRNDSLRSTFRADRFEKSKKMYKKLLEFSELFRLGEDGHLRAANYFLQTTIACTKMEVINKPRKKALQAIRGYMNDQILMNIIHQYPLNQLPWKQRLFGFCVKLRSARGAYALSFLQNRVVNSRI